MVYLLLGEKVFIIKLFGPSAQIFFSGPNFGPSKIAAQIWAASGPKKNTVFNCMRARNGGVYNRTTVGVFLSVLILGPYVFTIDRKL